MDEKGVSQRRGGRNFTAPKLYDICDMTNLEYAWETYVLEAKERNVKARRCKMTLKIRWPRLYESVKACLLLHFPERESLVHRAAAGNREATPPKSTRLRTREGFRNVHRQRRWPHQNPAKCLLAGLLHSPNEDGQGPRRG